MNMTMQKANKALEERKARGGLLDGVLSGVMSSMPGIHHY